MLTKSDYKLFNQEFAPHADSLYNYAQWISGDAMHAEDLVQESYLKALRYIKHYEPGSNSKAWLFRILKNIYINEYRKENRQPIILDISDISFTKYIQKTKDLYDDLFHFDDKVRSALQRLPSNLRTVFILKYVEEYKYEEIASIYSLPLGTVKIWLHRSKKLLRLYLAKENTQSLQPA